MEVFVNALTKKVTPSPFLILVVLIIVEGIRQKLILDVVGLVILQKSDFQFFCLFSSIFFELNPENLYRCCTWQIYIYI